MTAIVGTGSDGSLIGWIETEVRPQVRDAARQRPRRELHPQRGADHRLVGQVEHRIRAHLVQRGDEGGPEVALRSEQGTDPKSRARSRPSFSAPPARSAAITVMPAWSAVSSAHRVTGG